MKSKETVIDKLRGEERDLMDRLDKLKKELKLTRDFMEKCENDVE